MFLEITNFTPDLLLWHLFLLTVLSLGVDVLGGIFRLALGTMRLPALLFPGVAPPIAARTNILVNILASLGVSIRHFQECEVVFE